MTRIACIYRSPSAPSKIVTEQAIEDHFQTISISHKGNLLIAGDFNFPQISWKDGFGYLEDDATQQPFLDCIHDLSLYQSVDKPTRYRIF